MSGLISNLQLGTQIGSGYFGIVRMGKDDVHGDVAVKVFEQRPGESSSDWQVRKNGLLQEGQHLKQAAHPNVVPVFQVLEAPTSDGIYLVMEYCAGGSLQARFERGPMQLINGRRLITEVALGLHALHSRTMLHRDIKPANILLDGNNHAKLADFGLVTDNIILGYASQAGYSDHIAYEVWHQHATSIKSDIWALGMTLYRLLHGLEWYSRSLNPQLLVPKGGFADTLKWLPHIPKTWRRVIRKMLNDDPDARYQSANEVMNALATLPIEPRWSCVVTTSEVRWRRPMSDRRMIVSWTTDTNHRHEWVAWSEPKGQVGRNRTFGKSKGPLNYGSADKELKEFFASQAS